MDILMILVVSVVGHNLLPLLLMAALLSAIAAGVLIAIIQLLWAGAGKGG